MKDIKYFAYSKWSIFLLLFFRYVDKRAFSCGCRVHVAQLEEENKRNGLDSIEKRLINFFSKLISFFSINIHLKCSSLLIVWKTMISI